MTTFESEIYSRSEDDVIGVKIIASANNGQTIDTLQVTNKTQFDELVEKLNTLNEDYVQFEDDSGLVGKTLDDILANTEEEFTINAVTLNGFQSDYFAKSNHTHKKSNITDLYNYDISLSKYNINRANNESTTVTVRVTNMSGSPVANHDVVIYKNGSAWKSSRTNSNGVYSVVYFPEGDGLVTFAVVNQKVQLNVMYDTGWLECEVSRFFNSSSTPKARRIGNVVHVKGAVSAKEAYEYFNLNWTDYTNILMLPDSRFHPENDEVFVCQSSKKQRCSVLVYTTGGIVAGRFTDANASGAYNMPKNLWIPVALTYFVDD